LTLTLYATPETLPEGFQDIPERVRAVAAGLVEAAGGVLQFAEVDPTNDADLKARLSEEFGIRPLAVDLFGRRTFYLDLLLSGEGAPQRILPRSDLSEADLRVAIEAAIRRVTPGQLKTIALFTENPVAPPPNPNIPPQFQPPPPRADYQIVEQLLSEDYGVQRLQLEDGIVPANVDALIVAKPGAMTEHQRFAIDQYLMRGGKVIALVSRYAISADRGGLTARPAPPAIFEMLETWGVNVVSALVMDPQNVPFPIPVEERRGGFRFQRIRLIPYPFFADIRREGFSSENPAFLGIPNVTTPWASPLEIIPLDDLEAEVLLTTSPETWLNTTGNIDPDFQRYPGEGFRRSGDLEPRVVGASVAGRFPSFFTERASPLFEGSDEETADGEADRTGRTMKESLPDAKLVVLASNSMVSDLVMQLSAQPGGEVHRSNLQLVQNLVDWSVEDTDLLAIRSSGAFTRTLRPMSEAETRIWELSIYVFTAVLLAAVTLIPGQRRRRARSLSVPLAGPEAGEAA
jgi:ABC-2 type transport system permease protein